jgi:hypothetical protein
MKNRTSTDACRHKSKDHRQSNTEILFEMLACGLLELRMLCQHREHMQAFMLADAFHNIPDYAINPEKWDPQYFVSIFTRYEELYPKSNRIGANDYLAYLNKLN